MYRILKMKIQHIIILLKKKKKPIFRRILIRLLTTLLQIVNTCRSFPGDPWKLQNPRMEREIV